MPLTENDLRMLATPDDRKLDANDRCQRCSAQAYTRWEIDKPDVPDLLFCSHHTTDHEPALIEQGWRLTTDERHLLLVERESSA